MRTWPRVCRGSHAAGCLLPGMGRRSVRQPRAAGRVWGGGARGTSPDYRKDLGRGWGQAYVLSSRCGWCSSRCWGSACRCWGTAWAEGRREGSDPTLAPLSRTHSLHSHPKPTLVSSAMQGVSLGQLSSSTRSLGHGRDGAALCKRQEPAQGTHWGAGPCPSPLPSHPIAPHLPLCHGRGSHSQAHIVTVVTIVTIGLWLSPAAPHLGVPPAQLHQGGHGVVEQEQDARVGVDRPGVAGVELQGVGLGAVVVQDDVIEAKQPVGTEEVALTPQPGPAARLPPLRWQQRDALAALPGVGQGSSAGTSGGLWAQPPPHGLTVPRWWGVGRAPGRRGSGRRRGTGGGRRCRRPPGRRGR